jgi:hypothetical protein
VDPPADRAGNGACRDGEHSRDAEKEAGIGTWVKEVDVRRRGTTDRRIIIAA